MALPNLDSQLPIDDRTASVDELRQELEYYRRQVDELAGEAVKNDYALSTLRHALRQKRDGFALLSELQQSIGSLQELASIFENTVRVINTTLGMDKSVMLVTTGQAGCYRPESWLGFGDESPAKMRDLRFLIPEEWVLLGEPLLVNGATTKSLVIEIVRSNLGLPYFIALPVLISGEPLGILLSGRRREQRPFAPPLDAGDVDTFRAIAALISAFVHNRQIQDLREDNELLRHLATIDKLTGIANRRRFEEVLSAEWSRAERRANPLSVFILDVDHFKKCNDTWGHFVGDVILKQVADRLTAGLRPGDVGARYGGEEFAVLLPDTTAEGALAVAERVRASIAELPMSHGPGGACSDITASVGVATVIPQSATDSTTLLGAADRALYEAKNAGRNRVTLAK